MSALAFLAVCAAGGAGAALRVLVDGLVSRRSTGRDPVGTAVVNVSGSFLLGFVTGLATAALLPQEVRLILGAGLLGGYTTFSTASVETVRLAREGRVTAALVNALGVLVLAVLLAGAGYLLGAAL